MSKYLEGKKYFPYLCTLAFHCTKEALITRIAGHYFTILHVYVEKRLRWAERGRREKGRRKWIKRAEASRIPFALFICSISFGAPPGRKTVCVHTSKQRKLCMAFLPFEYRRHPPLCLMPLASMRILNIPTKRAAHCVCRCMCIDPGPKNSLCMLHVWLLMGEKKQ